MNRPWLTHNRSNLSLQIPDKSLYCLLEESVQAYPDHIAVIFNDRSITYSELKEQVDRLAGSWKQQGFQKGERIGLMITNHPNYIICYYAALSLGLIVVQINPLYTLRELQQVLHDSQLHYIVGDEVSKGVIQEASNHYAFSGVYDQASIEAQFGNPNPNGSPVPISVHEDVAVIQYTGGTSGKVKGAMLTHSNLVANVIQSLAVYGEKIVKGKETTLTVIPLYHVYGMTSAMNFTLYIGGTILLYSNFEMEEVLQGIMKYKPTVFMGVPKLYNAFVHYPGIENFQLNCLKICSCGSAPLPVEVLNRFETLTGTQIYEGFGLSEASPSTHRNPIWGMRKVGSIGIPLPETDCILVDENHGEVGVNQIGEMLIKGPQVMKGYWNNEEETQSALRNGWLYTGDLARMDEDGYFYIVGRKKEMIIIGGFNVYPKEIEHVLFEHSDILEAAVVGIPQGDGEIVKAYVVPKNGALLNPEQLRDYCKSKLTKYKVPKMIEIRDRLPRNTVGKLLKRILIEEELQKLGK